MAGIVTLVKGCLLALAFSVAFVLVVVGAVLTLVADVVR